MTSSAGLGNCWRPHPRNRQDTMILEAKPPTTAMAPINEPERLVRHARLLAAYMTNGAAVTIPMPDGLAAVPELTCELPGGRTGYYRRRTDDCWHATMATALQVPYEEVPPFWLDTGLDSDDADQDPEIRRAIFDWVRQRGFSFDRYPAPATHAPHWIGMCDADDGGRHIVVCAYDRIVFDPNDGLVWPDNPGMMSTPMHDRVQHGWVLTPLNERP